MIKKWVRTMKLQDYFDDNNELYIRLHMFLESESDSDECYSNLNYFFEQKKIKESRDEIKTILHLISKISKNHHLSPFFENNIKRILNDIKDYITNYFTNFEIFRIFKNNKRQLLFLFSNKTIIPDSEIFLYIVHYSYKHNDKSYGLFLYPEIQSFFDNETKAAIENQLYESHYKINENFEEKRQIGENDSLLCKLIREDLIDQFTSYSSQTNLDLTSKISHSIFETHSFLIKNNPTIIEYAAFFGSINIVKYLYLHDVELEPSLWLYAIHSKNAEMIHFLEDNHVELEDKTYYKCLQETIKCHHIDFSQYIQENFMKYEDVIIDEKNFDSNLVAFSFRYYNFAFFPRNFYNFSTILYALKYDYLALIKILMETQRVYLNEDTQYDAYRLAASKNNYEIINYLLGYETSCIRKGLFQGCVNLTHVTIPSNIICINSHAFANCTSLIHIEIPSSVTSLETYCFYECPLLEQIVIPSSVTLIGFRCFSKCSSLKQIVIPSSVTKINEDAFSECSSLTQITFQAPSSITAISRKMFAKCSSLKEIIIPQSVTSINDYAFAECSSLQQIEIPSSVISIGKKAFYLCSSLKKPEIPPSVTSIGDQAFQTTESTAENPKLRDDLE